MHYLNIFLQDENSLSTKNIVNMVYLSVEKRIFLVRTYFETHSFVEASRLFRERFPGTEPANKTTIFRKRKKYLDHGTSLNMCSKKIWSLENWSVTREY